MTFKMCESDRRSGRREIANSAGSFKSQGPAKVELLNGGFQIEVNGFQILADTAKGTGRTFPDARTI